MKADKTVDIGLTLWEEDISIKDQNKIAISPHTLPWTRILWKSGDKNLQAQMKGFNFVVKKVHTNKDQIQILYNNKKSCAIDA